MNLRPASAEELARSLREASQSATRAECVDLSSLSRVLEHTPEDMTVTAEAGTTLAVLQRALAARGQWLPIDPPHPERLTLAALLDTNVSGPRRAGFGTIRDYVIGLRVALADGRLIRSGGKVVKNVAGYDLMKLFIGAHGTLGVIVEATFKLLPLPEAEALLQARCDTLEAVERLIATVLNSELTPIVFDLHNLGVSLGQGRMVPTPQELERRAPARPVETKQVRAEQEFGAPLAPGSQAVHVADELPTIPSLPHGGGEGRGEREVQVGGIASTLQHFNAATLVLGFSGARAAVDWQLELARSLGFTEPAMLDYEAGFHAPELPPAQRLSVLPSRLVEMLRALGDAPFVARAANGVILHRGTPPPAQTNLPRKLFDRVKQAFDPNGVFPLYPL